MLDRLIDRIEQAAAWFLAAVMALIFVSVILRYFFAWAIPDTNDISRLLLAILIFWGMAGAGYRGEHITVDLLWSAMPSPLKHAMDLFSTGVTLFAIAMLTWMMAVKVSDTRDDNLLTFDLHQPVWIYYLVAWVGLLAATILLLVRLWRIFAAPHLVSAGHARSAE